MATTEPRAGFRPPWRSDHVMDRDGSAERDPEVADAAQGTPEPAAEAPHDAPDSTAPSTAEAPRPSPGVRKPNKFLADLTRAMHAAAETERAAAIEQLHADSKTFVESIHTRSADEATDLKRRSDEDIAHVREWSKAEVARIREETEQRITARKSQLDSELEDHAAKIERQIDRVQRRVATFERDMAQFFEDLLQEADPASFAAKAAQLPEPPTFESLETEWEIDWDLDDETADTEPPAAEQHAAEQHAAEQAAEQAGEAPEAVATPVVDEPVAEVEGTATVETGEVAESVAETSDGADQAQAGEAEATAEPTAVAETGEAEAVAGETAGVAVAAEGDEDVAQKAAEHDAVEVPGDDHRWDAMGLIGDSGHGDEQSAEAATETEQTPGEEPDPRLAALGATEPAAEQPDFASAEAAAVEAAMTDDQIQEIGEESIAARLANLVPGSAPHGAEAPAKAVASQTTQVVVVGLVSVASIASFKRQLGRQPGVQSVGVASGPDGEFVFTVTHAEDVSLRDVVPTLPGFQARVVKAGDGVVNVSAHDPESDN